MAEKKSGLIYELIPKIMAAVGPIAKNRKNQAQNYAFRGVDDVYEALQLLMAEHGVFSVPHILSEKSEERINKNGTTLIYRILHIEYTFYAHDGSFVKTSVIGEGMDTGDKAANKAMSVADKYACLQTFKIPTNEPKDPENEHHEVAPNETTRSAGNPAHAPRATHYEPRNTEGDRATHAGQRSDGAKNPPAFKPNPAKAGEVISEKQGKRLFAICNSKGWTQQELKQCLTLGWGINSTKEITRAAYEEIVAMVEKLKPSEALASFMHEQQKVAEQTPHNSMFGDAPPFTDADLPF